MVKDVNIAGGETACSDISCHSDGNFDGTVSYNNPLWSTGSLGCDGCHGSGGNAYPTYANGGVGVDSNTHGAHMSMLGVSCGDCHGETTTDGFTIDGTVPSQHVNGAVEVVLSSGSYAGETCSSQYCHSLGQPALVPGTNIDPLPGAYGVSPGSIYTDVTWGDTAIGCNGCHGKSRGDGRPDYSGGTKGTATANSHLAVTHQLINCQKCHWDTTNDGTSITGTLHTNATIDVTFNGTWDPLAEYNTQATPLTCIQVTNTGTAVGGCHIAESPQWGDTAGCTTCHGYPPVDAAGLLSNPDATGRGAPGSAFETTAWGQHQRHAGAGAADYGYACQACHYGLMTTGGDQDVFEIEFFLFGSQAGGAYDAPLFSSQAWYASTIGGPSSAQSPETALTAVTNVGPGRTCSNIYCHSDGQGVYRTADWDTAGLGCDDCHGDQTGTLVTTDRHGVHTAGGTYGYSCYECHSNTVDAANALLSAGGGPHVNNTADVAWRTGSEL